MFWSFNLSFGLLATFPKIFHKFYSNLWSLLTALTWFVLGEFDEVCQLIFVESPHHDAVDLERLLRRLRRESKF